MCATSIDRECAELFRSYDPPSDVTDTKFADITVKEAALATSAAPTYLPKVKIMNEKFWDGGLLNNNPINQVCTHGMTSFPSIKANVCQIHRKFPVS